MIAAERARLADALAGLPADDWDRPSLCGEWSVREVVAHIIATASMTPPRFFGKLAASGFSFQRMVRREIDALTAQHGDEALVDLLRARVDARTAPPGPTTSWLGETIVHGEDVFRARGGYLDHPVAYVLAVADFYKGSNLLIGAKKRIEGVTLRATDADWWHGSGPVAEGRAIAIVLAMTGRKVALEDLSGEGVGILRSRD